MAYPRLHWAWTAESGVMQRPPLPATASIFSRAMVAVLLVGGTTLTAVTLGVGLVAYQRDSTSWQTLLFTMLVWSQMGVALGVRSAQRSLLGRGFWSHEALLGAVGLTILLQLAVVFLTHCRSRSVPPRYPQLSSW